MKSSANSDLRTIFQVFQSEVALTLWILYERYHPHTTFKDYLEVLPKHVPSLLTFSLEELKELQNESLEKEALQLQQSLEEEFVSFQSKRNESVNPLPSLLSAITYEDYVWASTIINSRGLRFRGEVYLAPMADLFNYETHYEKREANSGEFFLKHHVLDKSTGSITVYADRSQVKGLQLFEDYGDNNNEIYVKYHGFVPNKNPFHCVVVGGEKAILSVVAGGIISSKRKLLEALQLKTIYPSCVGERRPFSKHIIVYLATLAMNEDEMNVCLKAVTDKSKKDWNKIFDQCGFASVEQYVSDRFSGKDDSAIERQNALAEVEDEEDEYIDVKPDLSSSTVSRQESIELGRRTWNLLRQVFNFNVKAVATETTIHEDVEMLANLQASMKGLDESSSAFISYLHHEVAVRYRLANKRLYLSLCSQLQVDCDFLIRRNSYEENVQLDTIQTPSSATSDDSSIEVSLQRFNDWFNSHSPRPSLIKAVPMEHYRIGVVTTGKVSRGELYLGVPTNLIMDSDKANSPACPVHNLLLQLNSIYRSRDDFHELLFFLLHETFVMKEKSFFWPYLKVLPREEDLDIPILWTVEQLQLRLPVSSLQHAALSYQQSVYRKFDFIQNISQVRDFFGDVMTFNNYRWATAILDSRSIWWDGKRHLVPMLDFINCREGKDPSVLHSTALSEDGNFAVTRAGEFLRDDFGEGEQLFENYGQPNHIYFLYHGFVLENNSHDCVNLRFPITPEQVQEWENQGLKNFLRHFGISATSRYHETCVRWPITPQLLAFLSFQTEYVLLQNIAAELRRYVRNNSNDDEALKKTSDHANDL
eukprot:scaffold1420_cov182-Ochromonas_danica.AAC.4